MGYRTFYNLFIKDVQGNDIPENTKHEIIDDLRENYNDAADAINDEGQGEMDTNWENDADMNEFSLKYPNMVFEVSGTGDDAEDRWSTYYKNGKMQHCPVEFVYPPYDENKLV